MSRISKPSHPKIGMYVKEIMTRNVVTISPAAKIKEAARTMADHDVGILPACENGKIFGVVTDRDIVVRGIAEGFDPDKCTVADIFTPEVFYVYDHEDVQVAVESMEEKQIRRILVLDRQKRLVGILSIGDVAVDTGDKTLAGEILKKISEPEKLPV